MARGNACYGNTQAVIIGRHTGAELRRIADMLETNDYKPTRIATCMPAYKVLAQYSGYRKLFGERKYAAKYPSRTLNSGFLDLPGEIRNTIYTLAPTLDAPSDFVPLTSLSTKKSPYRVFQRSDATMKRLASTLRLLRVNRQVNQEASDIYYGSNEFRFTGQHGAYFLRGFMNTIGEANAARLRKVTMHIHLAGYSTDDNDYYGDLTTTSLGQDLCYRKLKKDDSLCTIGALAECLRFFEGAGNLSELNLVLPFAFRIYNLRPLGLNKAKSESLKVKLVHLYKDQYDEQVDQSQTPMRKTVALSGKKAQTIEQYADPEAYAKAIGWGYEMMVYDQAGSYPARDPMGRVGVVQGR